MPASARCFVPSLPAFPSGSRAGECRHDGCARAGATVRMCRRRRMARRRGLESGLPLESWAQ
eukprot:14440897-Alexandrium_andersonii.AAC.1